MKDVDGVRMYYSMLNESMKDKCHMILLCCGLKKQNNHGEKADQKMKKQTLNYRELMVAREEVVWEMF